MRTFLATFGLLLASACTYDDTFSTCPMSKAVLAACASGGGSELSCVVRDHPQCSENVCLSWKGGESRCTKTCKPEASDCPSGSKCLAYAEFQDPAAGEYFCVQDELVRPTDNVTVAP